MKGIYLSHYNFSEKPFQTTTDPKFIWLGEKHAKALARMEYGIRANKGFLLLTGDPGTGKTAVINTLLQKVDKNVIAVMIPDPGLDSIDLYNVLSNEFKMNRKFSNKGDFLNHFKTFLHETYLQSKTILLMIDEAQNLSHELLNEIRLLSNIETAGTKLINVFMVGQVECNAILNEKRNTAFKQRIGIRYHLDPFNESETRAYIDHRLKIAGSDHRIFNPKAIQAIYCFSAGYPRLINAICDLALLTGYASGTDLIDERIIEECTKELQLSGESAIFDKKTGNGDAGGEQIPAAVKIRPGWRRINFAAAIVGVILITGFIIYNVFPNRPQLPKISEEAFQNYKRYEEKIDHVKKELRSAKKKELVSESSEPTEIEKKINKNIDLNKD